MNIISLLINYQLFLYNKNLDCLNSINYCSLKFFKFFRYFTYLHDDPQEVLSKTDHGKSYKDEKTNHNNLHKINLRNNQLKGNIILGNYGVSSITSMKFLFCFNSIYLFFLIHYFTNKNSF